MLASSSCVLCLTEWLLGSTGALHLMSQKLQAVSPVLQCLPGGEALSTHHCVLIISWGWWLLSSFRFIEMLAAEGPLPKPALCLASKPANGKLLISQPALLAELLVGEQKQNLSKCADDTRLSGVVD